MGEFERVFFISWLGCTVCENEAVSLGPRWHVDSSPGAGGDRGVCMGWWVLRLVRFLCWGMCQALLLRRVATTAWQADLQNKVSVSKDRALEARRVLSLSSKNQFFKTKTALPSV